MCSSVNRQSILFLYHNLLRESKQFDSYMYRKYAFRRIRDAFKDNKGITDEKTIQQLLRDGHKNLQLIKRQVVINNLYKSEKLVVEDLKTKTNNF